MSDKIDKIPLAKHLPLDEYLAAWVAADPAHSAAATAVSAIADVCIRLQALIAGGNLVADHGAKSGINADGDAQTALDIVANDWLIEALRTADVASIASEENEDALVLGGSSGIAVAFDPLDGSSNVNTNVSIGTIFAVLPAQDGLDATFFQPGTAQIAAGYIVYGPQCMFALTVGDGTQMFTLDPETRVFRLTDADVRIPPKSKEYAINASNYRHWGAKVRAYVDDCVAGRDGPRGEDTNTRWIASMVAEAHRILVRGGVYLYPRDMRKNYENGRLRLIYEGNPIAFLIEQAGGKAFDGRTRILDLVPTSIHQRVPLMFGSADEIDRIARYKSDPNLVVARAPLFHRRGLFKGV